MKVLHINSYYYAGKFYKHLYERQVDNDYFIKVFVPLPFDYSKNDFDYGSYTTLKDNHNKIDRFFFHLKHKKILKSIKSEYKIDKFEMIHAHSLFSNGYIGMKLNEEYKVPYIVTVRNADVNVFLKNMIHLRPTGIKIMQNASKIIFLSEAYKNKVIKEYVSKKNRIEISEKSIVITNGIDDYWLKNKGTVKDLLEDKKINIIQVGDIDKNKNITTTIKVIKELKKIGFDVKFDVVGKIKNKKIYKTLKEYTFVNYLGYKSQNDLIEIYRKNNIFIMPSISETFGLVYAEAMSQGLPVIYSRDQGFDRQFEEGFIGFSVESKNVTEIIEAVLKIIANYKTMSKNCLIASDKYNWDLISTEYDKLYGRVNNT